jgi:hypothetical protein
VTICDEPSGEWPYGYLAISVGIKAKTICRLFGLQERGGLLKLETRNVVEDDQESSTGD